MMALRIDILLVTATLVGADTNYAFISHNDIIERYTYIESHIGEISDRHSLSWL